jgi:hypothetical protein
MPWRKAIAAMRAMPRRWPAAAGALAAVWLLLMSASARSDEATGAAPLGVVADRGDIRLIEDMADVLGRAQFRILPVVGRGPVQNASDLLHLKGIDFAILPSNLFAYLPREALPEAAGRIRLVLTLYDEQFHLLARNDVPDVAALNGRKVAFGARGSGDAVAASMVFGALGVRPQPVFVDAPLAIGRLQAGEIAAVAVAAAKPAAPFHDVNREQGVHFLPIRMTPRLSQLYKPAQLGIEDYPLLIGAGEAGRGAPVPMVALSMVLAAFDFTPESQRGVASARLVDAFFRNLPAFLAPPHDPRWRQADPAAIPPGWTRYAPALAWTTGTPPVGEATAPSARRAIESPRPQDQLFQQFLRWQQEREKGLSGTEQAPR